MGKVGKSRQKREHGLDAFAGGHDVARHAEADRVAEQMAHGAPWIVSIGALPPPSRGSSQVRCTPVILPSRSVTAAISAGQVSVGAVVVGRGNSSGDGSARLA